MMRHLVLLALAGSTAAFPWPWAQQNLPANDAAVGGDSIALPEDTETFPRMDEYCMQPIRNPEKCSYNQIDKVRGITCKQNDVLSVWLSEKGRSDREEEACKKDCLDDDLCVLAYTFVEREAKFTCRHCFNIPNARNIFPAFAKRLSSEAEAKCFFKNVEDPACVGANIDQSMYDVEQQGSIRVPKGQTMRLHSYEYLQLLNRYEKDTTRNFSITTVDSDERVKLQIKLVFIETGEGLNGDCTVNEYILFNDRSESALCGSMKSVHMYNKDNKLQEFSTTEVKVAYKTSSNSHDGKYGFDIRITAAGDRVPPLPNLEAYHKFTKANPPSDATESSSTTVDVSTTGPSTGESTASASTTAEADPGTEDSTAEDSSIPSTPTPPENTTDQPVGPQTNESASTDAETFTPSAPSTVGPVIAVIPDNENATSTDEPESTSSTDAASGASTETASTASAATNEAAGGGGGNETETTPTDGSTTTPTNSSAGIGGGPFGVGDEANSTTASTDEAGTSSETTLEASTQESSSTSKPGSITETPEISGADGVVIVFNSTEEPQNTTKSVASAASTVEPVTAGSTAAGSNTTNEDENWSTAGPSEGNSTDGVPSDPVATPATNETTTDASPGSNETVTALGDNWNTEASDNETSTGTTGQPESNDETTAATNETTTDASPGSNDTATTSGGNWSEAAGDNETSTGTTGQPEGTDETNSTSQVGDDSTTEASAASTASGETPSLACGCPDLSEDLEELRNRLKAVEDQLTNCGGEEVAEATTEPATFVIEN